MYDIVLPHIALKGSRRIGVVAELSYQRKWIITYVITGTFNYRYVIKSDASLSGWREVCGTV